MSTILNRRSFLAGNLGLAALSAATTGARVTREPGVKLKLGLNGYSFDKQLKAGTMTLTDAVQFCAQQGIDALDPTGYYFPGYPKTPPDEFVYDLKRTAFVNGVSLSGTGVRNNFAEPDATLRKADVQMVKDWIVVASKLGVPVVRVFSGPKRPEGHSFDKAVEWMIADFKECADFGGQHGVVVGLQQHDDFLKTADETIGVIRGVNSKWFGSILDVGSLRQGDPYAEIEKVVPYAVSWQIKEKVYREGKEEPVDLRKIKAIIDRSGYRGYVPFEALGTGDPKPKIIAFMGQIRRDFGLA